MSFSIMNTVNQSIGITLANLARVFGVTLLVVLATGVVVLVGSFLIGAVSSVSTLLAFIVSLLMFLAILGLFGGVFNYWIRVGALGLPAALSSYQELLKTGALNGIKMVFISMILVLILSVVFMVLGLFGVTPQGPEVDYSEIMDMKPMDALGAYMQLQADQPFSLNMIAMNLLPTTIMCFIYSFFSANLTRTALVRTNEGFEHPHTADFAVALILLYLIVLIPSFIAIAAGSVVLSLIVQLGIGIPVGAAIGIAHGVRYRLCMSEDESSPDNFPE